MAMAKKATHYITEEEKLHSANNEVMENVDEMTSYYRENPHHFAADYLNLKLKVFQQILICMMNLSNYFMFLACRGLGKTFLVAVFCCVRCLLYPGTFIAIASGNRKQAAGIIEKIINILMPLSTNLCAEIESYSTAQDKAYLKFYNTSVIQVVTSRDSARGARANILVNYCLVI